jgi:hypothetical protein
LQLRTNRPLQFVLIAVFVLPLLAHAWVGSNTRMMADDFCTSYLGRSEGMIGGFVVQYNTWAGQPSNILIKNAVGIVGSWVIPLLPLLVIGIWFLILVWTLAQIFKTLHLPRWLLALAAAAFLFAIFDGSPQITQSLYWLAAVVPYTMPLVLATAFIGFLARLVQSDRPIRIPRLLISGIGCFVMGGFSENYIVLQMSVLIAGLILCVLLPSPRPMQRALPILIAGLVGTILVLAVMLAAPGNAIRRANFPPSPSILTIAESSVIHSFALVFASMTSFSPLGAIITVALAATISYWYTPQRKIRIGPLHILLALILLFLPIGAYIAAGVYSTTRVPPARTYIIPQTMIVGVLALIGYVVGIRLKNRSPFRQGSQTLQWATVVLLIAALAFGPLRSTAQILSTLPSFQTFAAGFDQREQLIDAAVERGERTLVVPPLSLDIAPLIGLENIGSNPTAWVNACAAQYYGLESLAVDQQ